MTEDEDLPLHNTISRLDAELIWETAKEVNEKRFEEYIRKRNELLDREIADE